MQSKIADFAHSAQLTISAWSSSVSKQETFEKCWTHSPLRAAERRCPQQQQQRRRRQRQRMTEGTAMAP